MTSRPDRDRPRHRHALDADGMVMCNPRDPEAVHRAEVGDLLTTADPDQVSCPRCRAALHRGGRPPGR